MEANLRFNAYVHKNTSDARVASGNIARKRRKRMFTLEDGPGPDSTVVEAPIPLRDHASRVQSRSRACVVQCRNFQDTAQKEQFGTILSWKGGTSGFCARKPLTRTPCGHVWDPTWEVISVREESVFASCVADCVAGLLPTSAKNEEQK